MATGLGHQASMTVCLLSLLSTQVQPYETQPDTNVPELPAEHTHCQIQLAPCLSQRHRPKAGQGHTAWLHPACPHHWRHLCINIDKLQQGWEAQAASRDVRCAAPPPCFICNGQSLALGVMSELSPVCSLVALNWSTDQGMLRVLFLTSSQQIWCTG